MLNENIITTNTKNVSTLELVFKFSHAGVFEQICTGNMEDKGHGIILSCLQCHELVNCEILDQENNFIYKVLELEETVYLPSGGFIRANFKDNTPNLLIRCCSQNYLIKWLPSYCLIR